MRFATRVCANHKGRSNPLAKWDATRGFSGVQLDAIVNDSLHQISL
jgi:hypothetical protein